MSSKYKILQFYDKKTITLISAGCPEMYCHPCGENYAYNTEQILTGETTGTIDFSQPSTPRAWNDYVNATQYASSARTIKKSDLDTWYGKYIDNSISDTFDVKFPLNTENKLISTVENGCYYWVFSAFNCWEIMTVGPDWWWRCLSYANVREYGCGRVYGVRVLVSLTSDVKFNETPEKVEQDGFLYNKWIIE